MSRISRRQFAKISALLGVGSLLSTPAIEPIKRKGEPRLKLSLAAYSFREYFKDASHKRDKQIDDSRRIDLFQFMDFCAEHGCDGAEMTSYYFPKDTDTAFLLKLKRYAFLKGLDFSGTAVGNTFTHPKGDKRDREIGLVKRWIDYSAIAGFPHIRVFAGGAEGQSLEVAKKNCIDALAECCDYAGTKGVFLGLENHGGIVAESRELLDIIHTVDSPWLGINLDSANFHTEDPYADFEKCAPYAVNVQIKTEISPRGQKKSPIDLARSVKILKGANYQGYIALEYEAAEDPYSAVPRALKQLKELL